MSYTFQFPPIFKQNNKNRNRNPNEPTLVFPPPNGYQMHSNAIISPQYFLISQNTSSLERSGGTGPQLAFSFFFSFFWGPTTFSVVVPSLLRQDIFGPWLRVVLPLPPMAYYHREAVTTTSTSTTTTISTMITMRKLGLAQSRAIAIMRSRLMIPSTFKPKMHLLRLSSDVGRVIQITMPLCFHLCFNMVIISLLFIHCFNEISRVFFFFF